MLSHDSEEIKIILPARKIPDGSVVTKPTGTKRYELCKNLNFYDTDKVTPNGGYTITAGEGTVMLINGMNINIINIDSMLGWITSFSELNEVFENEDWRDA